jgi:outer membrane protein OmpA-like peptidoglycan-associated protein
VVPKAGAGTSKNGYHLLLEGFGEAAEGPWVVQVGGGFFYNRVYSAGEREFAGSELDTVREQRNLRIETRAGLFELALRTPLSWGFEAGLLAQGLFGSSLSFSQDRGSSSTKFFIGPQAVARLGTLGGYEQRLAISLTRSLNLADKKVYLLTGSYALGVSPINLDLEPKPAPNEDRLEEVFADKVINFPTASSAVQGPAQGFLEELGRYLRDHPDLCSSIEVEGHTDHKGRASYNLKLSEDRAQAVRSVLFSQGVASTQLTAKGFGPYRPLLEGDSPEALAANRRVVVIFNTKNKASRQDLSRIIKELRFKYFGES